MKWEKVSLAELCSVKTGKYDVNHAVENGIYPFYTCALQPFKANTYSFDDELIMLPGNGANVGEVMYYKGKIEAYQRTYVLHSFKANVKYVYYFLKSVWRRTLQNQQYGSATNYIRLNNITDLLVPLPPLHIQEQIADTLDKADALRKKDQGLLQKYDQLAQSIFYDMFGDPVRNEKGWDMLDGKKYAERICVGVVIQPASHYVDKGVLAIRSLNVRENYIDTENVVYFSQETNETVLEKSKLKTDDVLIVRTGQPGRSAVVTENYNGCNCIDLLILTPKKTVIDPIYLSRFFNSPGGHNIVAGNETGQIQKHLNVGVLNKTQIPVPPIRLQKRFSEIIRQLDLQKKITITLGGSKLFHNLLNKSFS